MNIQIKKYSEKSLLIAGTDTKKIKSQLKDFCIWNRYLNGWITYPKNKNMVESLINGKVINNTCLQYLKDNVSKFDKAVSESIGLKSLIIDDPEYFPKSNKKYGFVGFGCGFVWFEYDNRSKVTTKLIKQFNEVREQFINWYINTKVVKKTLTELENFGCPLQAVISQDININLALYHIAEGWINDHSGKIKYTNSRLD